MDAERFAKYLTAPNDEGRDTTDSYWDLVLLRERNAQERQAATETDWEATVS